MPRPTSKAILEVFKIAINFFLVTFVFYALFWAGAVLFRIPINHTVHWNIPEDVALVLFVLSALLAAIAMATIYLVIYMREEENKNPKPPK